MVRLEQTLSEVSHYLLDEPLWLDICACSDVVLSSEDELVIEDPLWLVVCGVIR